MGGGWCWASDDELVVATDDGRLITMAPDGSSGRVLHRDGRAVSPSVSARGEVAFAIERDDACDVAVVPLDGSAWAVRVSRADYAWDPAWSPDGRALAWHEWDLPDMPWDASRVVIQVMGGSETEISLSTGNVLLECARFDHTGDAKQTPAIHMPAMKNLIPPVSKTMQLQRRQ